jgi:TolB protein
MSIRSRIAIDLVCQSVAILWLATNAAESHAQPEGAEIAPPYELWKINADGSGLTPFADTPGYTCGSPEWSPDGTLVAFDTWRVEVTYSDSQIAIIRADGSGLRLLGPGAMPSWSPDGTQLVFHTYDNPQSICVMNADGSGREKILDHWGSPRWSPRGNRIASLSPDRQILLFDLITGKERTILPGRYAGSYHYVAQIGFGFSPDGLYISFGDDGGLFVLTLDEQTSKTGIGWLVRGGIARHCSWSPEGDQIVFAWKKSKADLEQIYMIDVDSPAPPTWLAGQDPKRNNACPAWSPDGETIVFASQSVPEPDDAK